MYSVPLTGSARPGEVSTVNGKGFKLREIKIEGFKGFTRSKAVPINGKHLFILGPNGCGKSSIVEAIRWGLFGSTRRPGEVVANQSYAGDCRVELRLEQAGREWTLKRRLVPGTSESRAELLDEHGQPHPLTSVLPELVSVPAGEGMHIIGKAQSAPLRRLPEDVSPFERTIYSYLGLSDVRGAIIGLEKFMELQEAKEKELGRKVDTMRVNIETELSWFTKQRDEIIKNPPWGAGSIPTQADTISKIEQFIKELSLGMQAPSTPVGGLDLGSLMREAEALVERAGRAKTSEVEDALRKILEKLKEGQSLQKQLSDLMQQTQDVLNKITSTEQSLSTVLAGETLDSLAEALREIERRVEETALLLDVQTKALVWLERQPRDPDRQHCPVCQTKYEDLIARLSKKKDVASSHQKRILEERDAIERRYQQALELAQQINQLKTRFASLEQELGQVEKKVLNFLASDVEKQNIPAALKGRIDELHNAELALERQLREASEVYQEWKRKLGKLQEEVRFHGIQERLLELERQRRQLDNAQRSLDTLVLFGDSVRAITEALKDALNDTLKRELPAINEKLTEAFVALTEHPAYDRVYIDGSILPKLELRVGSKDDPSQGWLPAQVLNGQALNALELVPYFAFSELTDLPFEVYLLLLDDPTQSFDSHHIEILVAKLAELGKRVQLVVASHEVGQFQHLLPKYFGADDYVVVSTTKWSRQDGPTMELSHVG